MPTQALLHDDRNEQGKFVAKRDGETKIQRRTRTSKQQIQRRLLTDLEQNGQAAIEKLRERDPLGYLKFATDFLGIAPQKQRGTGVAGVTVIIKNYADPDDASTQGVTIEAHAEPEEPSTDEP